MASQRKNSESPAYSEDYNLEDDLRALIYAQCEDDLRTMIRAEEIKIDSRRLARCKALAKQKMIVLSKD